MLQAAKHEFRCAARADNVRDLDVRITPLRRARSCAESRSPLNVSPEVKRPGMVLIDRPRPSVVRLTISRPDAMNSIDASIRRLLRQAILDAESETAVRAIVITGEGRDFSAGGDINTWENLDASSALNRMREGHELLRTILRCPKAVVAGIKGITAGNALGIALACDSLVAGESSRLMFSFSKLGVSPDYGLAWTLPDRVGLSRARQILLRGRTVSAADAGEMNLVDVVVRDEDLDSSVLDVADEFAHQSQFAFAHTKSMLANHRLEGMLQWEADLQALTLLSPDAGEGRRAFWSIVPQCFIEESYDRRRSVRSCKE